MTENKLITTDELLTQIFKEPNPERLFEQNETAFTVKTFSEYLYSWCKTNREIPEHIIRRANLEKSYGHQLFTGPYFPSQNIFLWLRRSITGFSILRESSCLIRVEIAFEYVSNLSPR